MILYNENPYFHPQIRLQNLKEKQKIFFLHNPSFAWIESKVEGLVILA